MKKNEREKELENKNSEEQMDELEKLGTIPLKEQVCGEGRIELITIIGEVEGHELVASNTKATKYEHLLPKLVQIESDPEVGGVLILLNTLGGDVEAGLSIAEVIASLSKPTVSLVLGGSHSIGGPLAVSADYSFIVPSGTMVIHPVRNQGMFVGVIQSFRSIERTQDRIVEFLSSHSRMHAGRIQELMLDPTQLGKDVGTMLEGKEAVREGLIDEVGGICQAMDKLREMIRDKAKGNAC